MDANTGKAVTGLSIADVDAGVGSITVTLSVAHGTLSAVGGSATITGSGTSNVVLTGTVGQINSTLAGTINYVPSSNYVGGDTLTMKTNDNGNVGVGGANMVTSTQGITVNSVAFVSIGGGGSGGSGSGSGSSGSGSGSGSSGSGSGGGSSGSGSGSGSSGSGSSGGTNAGASAAAGANNGGIFQSANEIALFNAQAETDRRVQTANNTSNTTVVNTTVSTLSSQNNAKIAASSVQTFTIGETIQLQDVNAPKLQSNTNLGALLKDIASGTKIHVEDVAKQTEAKHEESNNLLTLSVQRKAQLSGAAVSAGLVTWALSSTGLVSSVLATMPVWKDMDPVSILDTPSEDGPDLDQDDQDRNSEESAADVFSESDT
jgi:hypothetical protein